MSIDVKDIRVGNWFHDIMGYDFHVTPQDVAGWDAINCLPIPLTPELLEKCGFEVTSKGFYTHPNWYNLSLKYRGGTYDLRCNFMDRVATNIYDLHQLQNLYYLLCGQELKINL